jgi:hypothetical protein
VSPADDGLSKSPNRIEDQSIFQDYQAIDYVTVHIAIRKPIAKVQGQPREREFMLRKCIEH